MHCVNNRLEVRNNNFKIMRATYGNYVEQHPRQSDPRGRIFHRLKWNWDGIEYGIEEAVERGDNELFYGRIARLALARYFRKWKRGKGVI